MGPNSGLRPFCLSMRAPRSAFALEWPLSTFRHQSWMVLRALTRPCLCANFPRPPAPRSFSSSSIRGKPQFNVRNMNWHAAVVSARSADTRPSIVITFDSAKYVFGCAEGASRAYPEGAFRWARTRALFCARADARRAGGLAGMHIVILEVLKRQDAKGAEFRSYHGFVGWSS
jgi:hypothetical protein